MEGHVFWEFNNYKDSTGVLHEGIEFEVIADIDDIEENKLHAYLLDSKNILTATPSLPHPMMNNEFNEQYQELGMELKVENQQVNDTQNVALNAINRDEGRQVKYCHFVLPEDLADYDMCNELYSKDSHDGIIDFSILPMTMDEQLVAVKKTTSSGDPNSMNMEEEIEEMRLAPSRAHRVRFRVNFYEEVPRYSKTPTTGKKKNVGKDKLENLAEQLKKMSFNSKKKPTG